MKIEDLHPEDIRAAIRKKFGTIKSFEREYDLPTSGVQDILRGRTSARVRAAIEAILMEGPNTPARQLTHLQNKREAA
jgi:hypothetical protein